jgi:hypothetical protein
VTKTPVRLAWLVFLVVLGVGIAILFAADAFPRGVDTPSERGRFVGKTIGMVALLSAVGAWFLARSRAASRRRQASARTE